MLERKVTRIGMSISLAGCLILAWAGMPVTALAAQLPGRASAQLSPQFPPVCGNKPHCTEVSTFAAAITDFVTSVSGDTHYLTATIRFQNKTSAPLVLAYQEGSGIAIDDQGNRYDINSGTGPVRGIGIINRSDLDAKFRLDPGESRDARFEFNWRPGGREIFGTTFKAELTIREILLVPNTQQFRPGREYPLSYNNLGGPAASVLPVNTPSIALPPAAPPKAVSSGTPGLDPCAGIQRCFPAGPFTAELTQVVPTLADSAQKDRELFLRIKFRNVSGQPLVLAYVSRSASTTDEYGNRYTSDRIAYGGESAQGMAILGNTTVGANSSFTLKPGEARSATFRAYLQRSANSPVGVAFNWSATIAQLEVLPGRQIRKTGEYVLTFPGLTAGITGEPSPACAGLQRCDDAGPFLMDITQVSTSQSTNAAKDHIVQMTVRFRNVSDKPIILTYVQDTSVMIDNNGNEYVSSFDGSVKGIPMPRFSSVDPSFSLKPGEQRTASFLLTRKSPTGPLGTSFSWYLTIEQWESLSTQVLSAGQYALAFTGIATPKTSVLDKLRQGIQIKP